jgi:membrane protein required for colicin V production
VNNLPDISAFNALDWVIVVVVAISMGISLWRGFTREAISLAGWVVAYVAANLFGSVVAAQLAGVIENLTGRYIVAWAGIFVVVLILAGLVAKLISRVMKVSGLGLLDRLLGTVFGAARGLLVIMALAFLVRAIVPPSDRTLLYQSELMPWVDMLMDWSLQTFDAWRAGQLSLNV